MPSDDPFTLQPDEPSRRTPMTSRQRPCVIQTEFQWPTNSDELLKKTRSPADLDPSAQPADITSTSPPPMPSLPPAASPPLEASTSKSLGKALAPTQAVKRSLREIVERYLRDNGAPYINVDEAKRALFAGAKLRSFHFVVYRPDAKNWLVWATQLRKESRHDLLEWEKIFGDGFVAVVVKQMADATLRFQTLAGDSVTLK